MTILHVKIERGDEFLIAQGLEEPGVITQARTYDELISNILDAAELLLGKKDIHIELVIPPEATSATRSRSAAKALRKRNGAHQKRVA
jgi:predicted RNase H-like HicB family nuclease